MQKGEVPRLLFWRNCGAGPILKLPIYNFVLSILIQFKSAVFLGASLVRSIPSL